MQVALAEKNTLEKENEKLKTTSEHLRTSVADYKERNTSLQKKSENLCKLRDDLKEENERMRVESLETVKKEADEQELRKLEREKIQQLEKLLESRMPSLGICRWEDLEAELERWREYLQLRNQTEQRERAEELASCTQECEALQEKTKKLEAERDEFILSIAEKEQSLFFQQKQKEKQAEEIEEKAKVVKDLEERLCLQEREHEKLRASSTKKFEALQKKSRQLENNLELSVAAQEECEKQTREIEKKAKDAKKQILQFANRAIKGLSRELKTSKSDGKSIGDLLSTEQEKVSSLYGQVEQYFNEIGALKEENVNLKKELEKNEAAVNEGFQENKILSEKFHILKSKLSRLQKVLG